MAYERRLKRWIVVRLLADRQRLDVARFYKHADAEGHLQALRRLNPEARYTVIFDPDSPDPDQAESEEDGCS